MTHIKSKHGNIRFPCMQCDYEASFLVTLKKHIKVHHNDKGHPKKEKVPNEDQDSELKIYFKILHV